MAVLIGRTVRKYIRIRYDIPTTLLRPLGKQTGQDGNFKVRVTFHCKDLGLVVQSNVCLTVINFDKDSFSIPEHIKSNLLFFWK